MSGGYYHSEVERLLERRRPPSELELWRQRQPQLRFNDRYNTPQRQSDMDDRYRGGYNSPLNRTSPSYRGAFSNSFNGMNRESPNSHDRFHDSINRSPEDNYNFGSNRGRLNNSNNRSPSDHPQNSIPYGKGRGGFNSSVNRSPADSDSKYGNISSINRVENARRKRSIEEGTTDKKAKLDDKKGLVFIIVANTVQEFKREVELRGLDNSLVDEMCQYNARYQYLLKTKGRQFAESNSVKQEIHPTRQNCCSVCDLYFTDQCIMDLHCKTPMHIETNAIYKRLKCLAQDWFNLKHNPNHVLSTSTKLAEKVGIAVKLKEDNDTELYLGLDPFAMELKEFVISLYEKGMKNYWPQPVSAFFCRSCNYSEFPNQQQLDRHNQSARHLDYERHYSEAFCVSCQKHNGDKQSMEAHTQSIEHKQTEELMDFMKIQATEYYNSVREKTMEPVVHIKEECSNKEHSNPKEPCNSAQNTKTVSDSTINITEKQEVEINDIKNLEKSELVLPVKLDIAKKSYVEKSVQTFTKLNDPTKCKNCLDIKNNSRSQITQLLELRHEKNVLEEQLKVYKEQVAEYEKMKEVWRKKEQNIEKKTGPLDDYVVPLTGFMCTVCHQTLNSTSQAQAHQKTNAHAQNIKSHQLKFGLATNWI